MNNNNNTINILSLILQLISVLVIFQDFNNGDLMNELQLQDEKYLKIIIKNQEQILKMLKERKDNND